MYKQFINLLAVLLLLILAACGSSGSDGSGGSAAGSGSDTDGLEIDSPSAVTDSSVPVSVATDTDTVNSDSQELVPLEPDTDDDGAPDVADNCPAISNADQIDSDQDGVGDVCDATPVVLLDSDGDGFEDNVDNCFNNFNADQLDFDGDGSGDVCDVDDDNDGAADQSDCSPLDPLVFPGAIDDPADGVDSNCDGDDEQNIVLDFETDTDEDGLSDGLEMELGTDLLLPDTDADGVSDSEDAFPNDSSASLDSDQDGVPDGRDQFPDDPTETSDLNSDGLGDNANPFDGTIISGKVLAGIDTLPIANSKVSIDLINSVTQTNPVVTTLTGTDGVFSLLVEESLLPDSFVVVVTAEGYMPAVIILSQSSSNLEDIDFFLTLETDSFVNIDPSPSVNHLGDDGFAGVANSQFQRATEGPTLTRSFNLSELQASSSAIDFSWAAKGVELPNTLTINGMEVGFTPESNADGSYTEQVITLAVNGVLNAGANTLVIESVITGFEDDIDDFEFVIIGLVGFTPQSSE